MDPRVTVRIWSKFKHGQVNQRFMCSAMPADVDEGRNSTMRLNNSRVTAHRVKNIGTPPVFRVFQLLRASLKNIDDLRGMLQCSHPAQNTLFVVEKQKGSREASLQALHRSWYPSARSSQCVPWTLCGPAPVHPSQLVFEDLHFGHWLRILG